MNDKEKYTQKAILDPIEKDKIYSQIYLIECTKTNKKYVGQAISHRMNNKKYRYHGYIGRYKAHLCEAIRNTRKQGGSVYLNAAIREHGENNFTVKLIENCHIDDADKLEKKYIEKYKTYVPSGYNLTDGGKDEFIQADKDEKKFDDLKNPIKMGVNKVEKRGRDFGYIHKEETIEKMKQYYETITDSELEKKKKTMRTTMSNYYTDKRAEKLAKLNIEFGEDYEKYIRPRKDNDGNIINYVIRINRSRKGEIENNDIPLEERYNILKNSLKRAFEIQQENKKKISDDKKETKKKINKKNDNIDSEDKKEYDIKKEKLKTEDRKNALKNKKTVETVLKEK